MAANGKMTPFHDLRWVMCGLADRLQLYVPSLQLFQLTFSGHGPLLCCNIQHDFLFEHCKMEAYPKTMPLKSLKYLRHYEFILWSDNTRCTRSVRLVMLCNTH